MKKVFISYSHKDEEWKDRLMPHLRTLEQQGDIVLWDDRKIGTGDDWYPAIEGALEQADVGICLISADYLASDFINKEEIPELKRRRSEDGMLLLPMLVRPCPWKTVRWLKGIQMFPRDGRSLAEIRGRANLEKAFSQIAEQVYEKIRDPAFQVAAPPTKWPPPDKVDTDRLPQTGAELFGRKKELELLDEAWDSAETRVVTLVAAGGFGKSTLVNKWLQQMSVDNCRGAKKVFGWSFYSQGTKERVTSADQFISEALEWFGDPDPTKGSPWDRGHRLAHLVRKEKALLILDGLEPLQSGLDLEKGKIKDPALSMLVTQLGRNNKGLCVITTREKVPELERFEGGVEQLNLEQVSKEAGRALLRVGGVQGTDAELEAASERFGNHALAINLLASYVHDIEGHHVSNAAQIGDLDIPVEEGRHPRRVIEAFEKRFGEGPQVQLLRILGLFDRPVEMDAIKTVYDGPAIRGLTGKLRRLKQGHWNDLLEELRRLKLLAKKSTHRPDIVDCHPLVREHFGEKLKKKPKAWKEAHGRLYEYYKGVPEKRLPDTLEEMGPLFRAVYHGCAAGRHQETLDDVFMTDVLASEARCIKEFGAFGLVLVALRAFFSLPWKGLVEPLELASKTFLLNAVGHCLRALGRLDEAVEPLQQAAESAAAAGAWFRAFISSDNLTQVLLALGRIGDARHNAQDTITYGENYGHKGPPCLARLTLVNALHEAGCLKEARGVVDEVNSIIPDYGWYPYGLSGVRCGDLLLSCGKWADLEQLATKWLYRRKTDHLLEQDTLTLGLEYILLGRANLMGSRYGEKGRLADALGLLDRGLDVLREHGDQEFLPRALLARAQFCRYQQSWDRAWGDLEEAAEIAERGEMNLYMADYHLEAARLCLAEGSKTEQARGHWKEAKERVAKMGYHRRDPEVMLIEAELAIVDGNKEAAGKKLRQAKKWIDEKGMHRWDVEVERLQGQL
jgi:tetratricopeptide (TPR) repeat protein